VTADLQDSGVEWEEGRDNEIPAKRVSSVLGMFSSLEVKVLCPTGWR